jgi:hypothetical protein
MKKENLKAAASSGVKRTKEAGNGLAVPGPGYEEKDNDESNNLKPFPLNLGMADKKKLIRHFAKKRLNLAAGIRMVLSEYMERERIF